MRAAVEISMYPLSGDYRPPIRAFIDRLHTHAELEVFTNALSTQVWGPLDRIMAILAEEMRRAADGPQLVFVMKVLPGLPGLAFNTASVAEPSAGAPLTAAPSAVEPSAEARFSEAPSVIARSAGAPLTEAPSAVEPSAEARFSEAPSVIARSAGAPLTAAAPAQLLSAEGPFAEVPPAGAPPP